MSQFKRISLALSLAMSSLSLAYADTSYNNMFISYVDPQDVQATVKYANSIGIHNFFFWTYSGDADYNSNASLIQAVNNADGSASIGGYWADWEMYNSGNAIPTPAYPIENNDDLTTKLAHSNTLIYAFLEAQVGTYSNAYQKIHNFANPFITTDAKNYGSLYFFDPYADLQASDAFCISPPKDPSDPSGKTYLVPVTTTDPSSSGTAINMICDYVPMVINAANHTNQGYAAFANLGNFESFANLSTTGKDGQPLQKVISVGGYGHNDTFEGLFNPPAGVTQAQAMTNFVNSAKAIMDAYHINGIDLDYEDPAMTLQQSAAYLKLIQMLSQALANDNNKYITLAILANPAYISGTEQNGSIGFDPNYQGQGSVLKQIAALPNVKAIDLMTYDFHGRWDYIDPSKPNPGGSTGETGFLSNLYAPNDSKVNQLFWLASDTTDSNENDSTLGAIKNIIGSYAKVGIGFPAYGRSFANVNPGQDGTGLFSALTASAIVPGGDVDPANCIEDITDQNGADNLCNGMFSYKYIVANMLNHGFTAADHADDAAEAVNGTTAFASTWSQPATASYTLTVVDANPAVALDASIGSFSMPGYIGGSYPNSQTFDVKDNPGLATIEGANNLKISVNAWYGQNIPCTDSNGNPVSFNFQKNTTITITGNSTQKNAMCTITQ